MILNKGRLDEDELHNRAMRSFDSWYDFFKETLEGPGAYDVSRRSFNAGFKFILSTIAKEPSLLSINDLLAMLPTGARNSLMKLILDTEGISTLNANRYFEGLSDAAILKGRGVSKKVLLEIRTILKQEELLNEQKHDVWKKFKGGLSSKGEMDNDKI